MSPAAPSAAGGPAGDGLRFGLLLPNAGYYADPARLLRLARAAEGSGWDGVFLWDHLLLDRATRLPLADAWTAVTAILAGTRRIRGGPLVTPLAQRQPWKVARETATLDHVSGGRLVFGVGLGASGDTDFAAFGLDPDVAARARRVDESLAVLDRLWSGREVSHRGDQVRLDRVVFLPPPVQRPRIPVWVAATWPASNPGPLARAARWDGVVPMVREPGGGLRGPDQAELVAILAATPARASGWTVAVPGRLPPDDLPRARALVAGYRAAGATWWLESFDPWRRDPRQAWSWATQGPPRP
ncbi:LLM class flavin-dependent oxidoreductase [Micromonospora sp. KC723]|uniref:LLM class flavin-dependent oxidoreductase n=1 Tax=Micromonospora sp. KC723 TaxID=2530381 RepID=UPI0010494E53|nr:LLM class flavin-dependent oxidoreductase [Micromonospora sp. KC723]TDB70041.1 LLM class flavin-dependent oxidoreductase [Micromonospora sp. KC723]